MLSLYRLFSECTSREYIEVENAASFSIERSGDDLYIYLECSNGIRDWQNNFDFPIKAYRKNTPLPWFCHRGFLKVWLSLEPYIKREIENNDVKRIYTVGYSHGAALGVLCHEYIWYNRPDLRDRIFGVGFGCPRVIFGLISAALKARWERFLVVRNIDDIVTHLPPKILGYTHVGRMLLVGKVGKYSKIDAHRPENISAELEELKEVNISKYINNPD